MLVLLMMLLYTLLCMTAWSKGSPLARRPGYACFHGDICHTHSGISSRGWGKQSCRVYCGSLHLLLHVCIYIWMGVSHTWCWSATALHFYLLLFLSHRAATWVVNGEMHALEVRGKQDRETTQAVSKPDSCRKERLYNYSKSWCNASGCATFCSCDNYVYTSSDISVYHCKTTLLKWPQAKCTAAAVLGFLEHTVN